MRAASRRGAPGIDGVRSLSEEALRRLQEDDAEHDDDPQGLADALARLIPAFALQVCTRR